ncbi:Mucin-20 [Apodemus speciosus]|uniref:Mucin-20 n=1 Tax=Apodemus speciosus TaxID=105296 RepID=A0ABQ0FLX6_APOSI
MPAFTQRDRPSSERAFQTTNLTQYVPLGTQTLSTENASSPLIATSISSEDNSRDTQTTSFVTKTRKTRTATSAASSPETQTAPPNESVLNVQTSSPTASSLDAQITSPVSLSLSPQTTLPVELTLKTQTISSVTESRTVSIRIPSDFRVVHAIPTETLAPSGSPRTGMSTVQTGPERDPIEIIFDTLCTDDSSEEARKFTIDLLTLARTSTEVEHLSSESSSSSDSSAGVLSSSRVLEPESETPAKGSVAFSITHIKLATCLTERETTVTIYGTPDVSLSPTEAMTALSTAETLTLPSSTEAKPKTTSSSGILSTASTPALAITLEGTVPTSGITESGAAVALTLTSVGTLVTAPLEDTSALSMETQNHTEVVGTITVPTVAGSTVGEAASFVSSTVLDGSSLSAVLATTGSAASETSATGNTTNSTFLTGSRPPSFIYSTTASTSKKPNIAVNKTTASPTPPMSPTTSVSTAWTRKTTKHDPGEDGGLLLVRLTVTSPEDLTGHKAREKLMYQLRYELHTHMPLVHVSLLSISRG